MLSRSRPQAGLTASMHLPRPQHGLSIVELMVGIAIGLFILAGATVVVSSQLSDNRVLLLETQIQQDLRSTADLITRDMRRGGFWGDASSTAWPAVGAPVPVNMYPAFWQSAGAGGRAEYNYSISDATNKPFIEDNDLSGAETFGFAWNSAQQTIEARVGNAGWQTLTDPSVVQITQFNVTVNPQVLPVPCAQLCTGGGTACWPQQTVTDLSIVITGKAVHDARVVRTVQTGVRLRNDQFTGACPT